ncbi:MAG: integration host factor subunit beta [Rickettsiales bacterium]
MARETMTKSELIQQLSKNYPHLYQRDIEVLVNTMFEEITKALAAGNRVELRGFGAFSVRKREARAARNPKNGAMVNVGERHAIYFRTGKELRERVTGVIPKE